MDDQSKRSRKTYSDEFKRDAVRLVVSEGYSFRSACVAVGVCEASLRAWHTRLAPPPEPCGDNAKVEELREHRRMPQCRGLQHRHCNQYSTWLCV